MKIRYIIAFLLLAPFASFAQKSLEKADKAFAESEYSKAIELYKSIFTKIMEDVDLKGRVAYNVGYSYRCLSKADLAELWLGKAVELQYKNPLSFLYYADALRTNEKYDEAIEQYLNYKKAVPDDERAQAGLKSCRVAKKWKINPGKYKIVNNAFINSIYSDFSPIYLDSAQNKMLFSSSNGDSTSMINEATNQPFTDLYITTKDSSGAWSSPQLFDGFNTKADEGTPTISSDFNEIFFTRCEFAEHKAANCRIYTSSKAGDAWSQPIMMKILSLRYDSFMVAHPAISPDGLKLYFVSNMPGGFGGYDIWYIERKTTTDKWSEPINVGDVINTRGNEMYPYVRKDGVFYFSSDGHHGMGGLDMYRINKDPKGKDQIVNLMYPMNSSGDDFGIVFENGLERGFLSSNRKGSKGYDDIWQFSLPPLKFEIQGHVKDENMGTPIVGTKVKLIGNDGTSLEVETDVTGSYHFDLKPSTNYVLLVTQKGYLNGKAKISTDGLEELKDFKVDIFMSAIDIPVELPNVMYDVGKWDLRPESIVSLEKMVEIMNDNPTIIIELSSHTDFRPWAKMSNKELSQKRAQSVVNFLISKGIDSARLVAKGYGETQPRIVDKKINFQYPNIPIGTVLNKSFIEKQPADKREIYHQINRRTQFKVLSSNYTKQ